MMPRKAFEITVELDIQAVTCPGVWLCPAGKVTMRILMLGSTAKTQKKPPVFPLLFHEKFIFRKTIDTARFLSDLQCTLSKEMLYTELVQWSGDEHGTVLATFETSLEELLYPSPCERGLIAGVDVDLLMEPSKCFPGILSPKIEVSTKTTIEEVLNPGLCGDLSAVIINPKLLCSKGSGHSHRRRQRKVCHSRPRRCGPRLRGRPCLTKHLQEQRPPFVVRHVEDDILDPVFCDSNNQCRRSRCHQCSLDPPRVCRTTSARDHRSMTPPRYEIPRWAMVPCDDPPRRQRPMSATQHDPSPCGPCCCDRPAPPPCLQTPHRPWQEEEKTRPYDKYAPSVRARGGADCQCPSCEYERRNCGVCDGYKKTFDVCKVCCYPIIPTKLHPHGCLCKPLPACNKKAGSDDCECLPTRHVQSLKAAFSDTQNNVDGVSKRCRRYPFLSCNEYPCGPMCATCLLNPRLAGKPVERRTTPAQAAGCKPSYREAFYQTLERFYKKLYKRARSRASEEMQRCPR